jgi:hypothetical protein
VGINSVLTTILAEWIETICGIQSLTGCPSQSHQRTNDMSKLTQTIEELEDRADLYGELLYAVQSKFEGESRHETALRYIKSAETRISGPEQCEVNTEDT